MTDDKHLWEHNDSLVEETKSTEYFYNWEDFVISKLWNSNYYYGCLPAYWVWTDKESEIFDEECEDKLILVYLSLAPCDARSIFIDIKRENEDEVRKWLVKHNFLTL